MPFDPWDQLLRRYVDAQGRVDYIAWKAESVGLLNNWLSEVAQTKLSDYSTPEQQLALWLNLYNALTIAQVLSRYPIASICPTILGIPNWISFFRFFSRPLYAFNGSRYSLNAIEHGVLRQTFLEPRIHFALVCASIGCPLLRAEAYIPDRVMAQLEEDAQRFIHNPHKIWYDSTSQTLYCSRIFKWYGKDFLKIAPSIPDYIQRYLNLTPRLTAATPIRYLSYDWQLNQRTSS